jgi:hypothetical protein
MFDRRDIQVGAAALAANIGSRRVSGMISAGRDAIPWRTVAAMDSVLLNRFGILLTFAASFLIAPELIGRERLQRLEGWLERGGASLESRVRRGNSWLDRAVSSESTRANLFHGTIGCLIGVGGLVVAIGWVLETFFGTRLPPELLLPSAIGYFVFIGLMFAIAISGTALAAAGGLARRVVEALAGDNRLAAWLTVSGIACLVLGTLFQFAATF